VAGRHELTLAEWTRIAPLLPARETRGTYYADHRLLCEDRHGPRDEPEHTVSIRVGGSVGGPRCPDMRLADTL
jgi:hypothetical protein